MALAGSMKYVCETALGFLPTAATKPKSDLTRIIIIKRDLIKQHFLVKCENYGCVFSEVISWFWKTSMKLCKERQCSEDGSSMEFGSSCLLKMPEVQLSGARATWTLTAIAVRLSTFAGA